MLQVCCISLLIYNYILSVGQSPQSCQKPNRWLDNNWARLISTDVGLWVCSTQNVYCNWKWSPVWLRGSLTNSRGHWSRFGSPQKSLFWFSLHAYFRFPGCARTLLSNTDVRSAWKLLRQQPALPCVIQDHEKSPYGIFIIGDNHPVGKLGYQLKSMCCFLVVHNSETLVVFYRSTFI